MTKQEFLDKLRSRLSILEESEINDIISEYEEHVDEKIKKGKTEEEAIKDFGDLDELVSAILKAYKLNDNYCNKKQSDKLEDILKDIFSKFESFITMMSKKKASEVVKFILEIIVIVFLLWLLKIPFNFFANEGYIFFSKLEIVGTVIAPLWKVLINLMYFVLFVISFLTIFKVRYLNTEEFNKAYKKETKQKERVFEEKKESNTLKEKKVKKEENEPNKEKEDVISGAAKVLLFLVKIFVVMFSMPAIASLVGLIACFGIMVGLLFYGVVYVGLLLMLGALIVANILFIKIIYLFIIDKKNKWIRNGIVFLVAILMGGIGISLCLFEFSNTTFYNSLPTNEYKIKTEEYEKNINELTSFDTYLDNDVTIQNDQTLNDKVIIKISYYSDYIKPKLNEDDNSIYINGAAKGVNGKNIFNEVIKNLKKKEIYNYEQFYEADITLIYNVNKYPHLLEE